MSWTLIIFCAFAGLAIAGALRCITRRSPVASAPWLVVPLFQLWILRHVAPPDAIQLPPSSMARLQQEQGLVGAIARPLFDTYLIPFEITSLLLLAALVGAVVLAKRKL